MLLLPLLMWILAAIVTWLLVTRLLIRPLWRLERAVVAYQPGEERSNFPANWAPARKYRSFATRSRAPSTASRNRSAKRPWRSKVSGGWCAKCTTA